MIEDQSGNLFPNENPEILPFTFQFGETVEGVGNRQAGTECEFWTKPYEVPDTDG